MDECAKPNVFLVRDTSLEIIKILKNAGHQAYWAGGCVRDFLLGKEPLDYDIVTGAKPEEIETLLERTIPIGKKFGVILAIENNHRFEIATFRSDSGYSDGRRPDAVIFTDPEADAKRRDFTVNGIFYDPVGERIFDFVGGQIDLKNRLIRFIGDPRERIKEDHLRILRAIRFKNTLDFRYHPETYSALVEHANLAGNVSPERLKEELNKMLISANRLNALRDLSATGVLKDVLPEVEAMKGVAQPYETHREGDVFEHSLLSLAALKPDTDLETVWAIFLHDVGKPETFSVGEKIRFDHHCERSAELAERILRRLCFPSVSIKKVTWLIRHHFMMVQLLEMPEGRRRHWFRHPWFQDLLELFRCDAQGQLPVCMDLFDSVADCYRKTLALMPKETPKLLTGEEVMKALNLSPGPRVGEIIEALSHAQLEGEVKNKRQALSFLSRFTSHP